MNFTLRGDSDFSTGGPDVLADDDTEQGLLTPFFDRYGLTLYHCRHTTLVEILKAKGIVVDAIITDPPYGQTSYPWDKWPDGWPELVRPLLSSKGSMWCCGTLSMWWDRKDEFHGYHRPTEDVIWEKHNGSGFQPGRFRRVHEQPIHFYSKDAKWTELYHEVPVTFDAKARSIKRTKKTPHMGQMGPSTYRTEEGGPRLMRSVIHARSCHGRAVNETQKPLELIEPLVFNACPPDGLVADWFFGSGTTAIACMKLGRRFIGCEVRRSQCLAAVEEIEKAHALYMQEGAQRELFSAQRGASRK